MSQIPKIIHYCWFGHNKMSKSVLRCINSWKNKCPDFKFIEWTENNFDVNSNRFTKIEYKKHNWAFVSDYVRLYALKNMGGIYLDTDVEVIKPLDPLLKNNLFMGLQDWDSINSGLITGSKPNNKNIIYIMHIYDKIAESHKTFNPIFYNTVTIITSYFRKLGFKYKNNIQHINGCTIYPTDYFCPQRFGSDKINITNNTYTIHHFSGSWTGTSMTSKKRKHIKEGRYIRKILGRDVFIRLYACYKYLKKRVNNL